MLPTTPILTNFQKSVTLADSAVSFNKAIVKDSILWFAFFLACGSHVIAYAEWNDLPQCPFCQTSIASSYGISITAMNLLH